MVNVSPRTVEAAAKVIKLGAPELVKAVDAGAVAVTTAAEVAELPREEQVAVSTEGQKQIIARANEVKAEKRKKKRKLNQPTAYELFVARVLTCAYMSGTRRSVSVR